MQFCKPNQSRFACGPARPERKTRQNMARQGPCGAVRVNLTYLVVFGVTVEDGFAEPVLLDERVADGDGIPTVAIRLFVGSAAALHKVQLALRTSGLVGEHGQRHSVGKWQTHYGVIERLRDEKMMGLYMGCIGCAEREGVPNVSERHRQTAQRVRGPGCTKIEDTKRGRKKG